MPLVIPGKYPQWVIFSCHGCGYLIKIERSLPDVISTGYTCQGCQIVSYRVVWGEKPEETRIEQRGWKEQTDER